jgi:hypothetical protein
VSSDVRKKYCRPKAKIKHFGADSIVDNELANDKLQTLNEVGVVDRCLDEPFGPPCLLGDPTILSASFTNIGVVSKRYKFGKNSRCLHILKTEKIAKFLHFPFVCIVKYLKFEYIFWNM